MVRKSGAKCARRKFDFAFFVPFRGQEFAGLQRRSAAGRVGGFFDILGMICDP